MKFLIAGAGAIGAYIGARMAKAGFDVTLFARAVDRAGNTGFDIYFSMNFNGKQGWQTVQGTSVGTPEVRPPALCG